MTQLAVRPSIVVEDRVVPVWRRVGRSVAGSDSAGDALRRAGLDWSVREQHLEISEPFGDNRLIRSHKAIVRTDTSEPLGVVGSRYQPIQNREAFDWLTEVLAKAGAAGGTDTLTLETAGELRGGRVVWMLARLPNELRVGRTDDLIRRYLLICNSHDGTKAFRALITPIRVVCQNSLTLALRDRSGVQLRHTQHAMTRIPEAMRILGLAEIGYRSMQTKVDALARVRLDSRRMLEYFDAVVRTIADSPEQRKEIRARLVDNMDDRRQRLPGIAGTLWAAFNAATQYADWERPVRGTTEARRDQNRLSSIWFGSSADLKRHAWNEALSMAASN
jgi:phage/plasmid-like protein (TIGR03299 family)